MAGHPHCMHNFGGVPPPGHGPRRFTPSVPNYHLSNQGYAPHPMNPTHANHFGPAAPMMQTGRHDGGGFLHGASNTVINHARMTDYSSHHMHNYFRDGFPVLDLLYQSSIVGTEVDSMARCPPPRCHPGTRVAKIKVISEWMTGEMGSEISEQMSGSEKSEQMSGSEKLKRMADSQKRGPLLWLYGYAGVGKTAIAQTTGESAKEKVILGAGFFFSRTRKHNDPARVFVSIAYQLATVNAQYRHAVNVQLEADPGLLEKDMRTQFKKLITEPLSGLKLDQKLLIIVDGLDECRGTEEQCEIIKLIGGAVSSPVQLPVVWMICSRPEYHIRHTFYDADSQLEFWPMELPVDDSQVRRDIGRFVRDKFKQIAKQHSIIVIEGESWPTAEDLEKIINAASGLFVYASTVVRFVEDPFVGDPESQLRAVISFIDEAPVKAATTNPLYHLDRLYEQIISEVHSNSLPLTLQLLGTSVLHRSLPILQLANLFGLSPNKFYAVLRQLYSVLEVPEPQRASQDALRMVHASFLDFLKDPRRSERFAIDQDEIHAEFAKACFNVLGQTKLRLARNLTWPPEAGGTPALSVAHQILTYCANAVWEACCNHEEVRDDSLFETIINFRYPFLRFVEEKIPVGEFQKWSEWLMKQIKLHNLQNIVQPVDWKDEYLRETFGSSTPDGSGDSPLRAYMLGTEANRVTVMNSSDFIVLSCEN